MPSSSTVAVTTTSNNDATLLSAKRLVLASTPLLLLALAANTDMARTLGAPDTLSPSLLEGCLRTFLQLSFLGSLLRPIFQANSPLLVLLYTAFMIALAAYETSSRTTYQFQGQFLFVLASLAGNVGWVAAWAFGVVLHHQHHHYQNQQPWWNPRFVIPIVGMLLGNSISAVSLSLNSLTTALVENQSEIDLWLSLGATPPEATRRLVRQAILAGTAPILNTMRVIGIVSIPGMMTGQLLGGSTTWTAAKYQIFIIFMIATCVIAVVLTNAFCVVEYIGFDPHHAFLHTHRLTKNKRPSVAKAIAMLWGVLTSSTVVPIQDEAKTKISSSEPTVIFDPIHSLEIRPLIQQSISTCDTDNSQQCTNPQNTPTESLIIENAGKTVSTPNSQTESRTILFQNVSFSVSPGDLWLVKGPSGAGKSTLLRGLAGLMPLDHGTLSLGSKNWKRHFATHALAAQWRQQIRYVVQAKVNLPGTPAELIHQTTLLNSWKQHASQDETEFQQRIRRYLTQWGFIGDTAEEALMKEWSQLSGGEAQRILIAIALASKPKFVLFDESTSALDKASKMAVEESVKAFVREGSGGVVWISHDEEQAERMSMADY